MVTWSDTQKNFSFNHKPMQSTTLTKDKDIMKQLGCHTPTDNKFFEHSGYAVYSACRINCKQFNSAWEATRYAIENNAPFITERVIKLSSGKEIDGKSIPIVESNI